MSDLADFKRKVVAKKEGERDPLLVLESKLAACSEEVNACRARYTAVKKTLDNIETDLINAKEAKRRAEEALEHYKQTRVMETSIDDATNAEVESYRSVMPLYMEKIAHEPPLRYMTISELETSGNA